MIVKELPTQRHRGTEIEYEHRSGGKKSRMKMTFVPGIY